MNEIQINRTIGYWTVLEKSNERDRNRGVKWLCRCICGKVKTVRGYYLKSGASTNCGCMSNKIISEKLTVHGDTGGEHGEPHYIYRLWSGIIQRTTNKNDKAWLDYGGRGITMQDNWLNSYTEFKRWILENIGERPTPKHSLDRIDNDKGYAENNVKWATKKQQAANRRQLKRTRKLEMIKQIFNVKETLAQNLLHKDVQREEYEQLVAEREELKRLFLRARGPLLNQIKRKLEQTRIKLQQAHKEQYERKSKGGTI